MTALSTSDALAKAVCPCGHRIDAHGPAGCMSRDALHVPMRSCDCRRLPTAALSASGAVVDAATLADDEALVAEVAESFGLEQAVARTPHERRLGLHARRQLARVGFDRLAAALSERGGDRA